jgi:Flp pilus assembly protein TadB
MSPAHDRADKTQRSLTMNLAALIIIIIAVVLAITGGIWSAANWLIWVAIVLAVIALIMFLLRLITGRSKV